MPAVEADPVDALFADDDNHSLTSLLRPGWARRVCTLAVCFGLLVYARIWSRHHALQGGDAFLRPEDIPCATAGCPLLGPHDMDVGLVGGGGSSLELAGAAVRSLAENGFAVLRSAVGPAAAAAARAHLAAAIEPGALYPPTGEDGLPLYGRYRPAPMIKVILAPSTYIGCHSNACVHWHCVTHTQQPGSRLWNRCSGLQWVAHCQHRPCLHSSRLVDSLESAMLILLL